MLTITIAYIIVAAFLFMAAVFIYVALFQSKDKDGAFILAGLIMGILFLVIAYVTAKGAGL